MDFLNITASSLLLFLVLPGDLSTMSTKFMYAYLFLSLLASGAVGLRTPRLSDAQQCRLNRLTGSRPSHSIESEGGIVEFWDEREEQFQCAGVAPSRIRLHPNSLHLPSFHPSPRLAYVEQGRGLMGVVLPGCAETFTSQSQERQQEQEWQGQQQQGDQHQKIHPIRRGDVVAIPAGATHWIINEDQQEELVIVSINDLNHLSNQLDQRHREFFLAGQARSRGQQQQPHRGREEETGEGLERVHTWGELEQGRSRRQNILRGFDTELLSEAFNVPSEIVRQIQREDERGICVRLQHPIRSMVRPDERAEGRQEEEEQRGRSGSWWAAGNGLEETICSMKLHLNIDQRRETDVHSRQAGRVTMVDQNKLPILKYIDLSLEKTNLNPNAMMSPHWSASCHCMMYVLNGDAHVQIVNHEGRNIMNDRVNQGEMVVVPQQFAATIRAGNNGAQFVTLKTSGMPQTNTLAGYTSVMRAMPLQVVRESYRLSPNQAQQLKNNRWSESLLLSPTRRSRQGGYN